jgi:hypothetical protein
MEKGVEKILLERQIAKDRGVLGAVNVAVWHRSLVFEPKKDLEKKLPERVAKKYLSKKAAAERFGQHAASMYSSDVRTEAIRGGRGGEELISAESTSKSARAIEKLFQA